MGGPWDLPTDSSRTIMFNNMKPFVCSLIAMAIMTISSNVEGISVETLVSNSYEEIFHEPLASLDDPLVRTPAPSSSGPSGIGPKDHSSRKATGRQQALKETTLKSDSLAKDLESAKRIQKKAEAATDKAHQAKKHLYHQRADYGQQRDETNHYWAKHSEWMKGCVKIRKCVAWYLAHKHAIACIGNKKCRAAYKNAIQLWRKQRACIKGKNCREIYAVRRKNTKTETALLKHLLQATGAAKKLGHAEKKNAKSQTKAQKAAKRINTKAKKLVKQDRRVLDTITRQRGHATPNPEEMHLG